MTVASPADVQGMATVVRLVGDGQTWGEQSPRRQEQTC